MNEGKQKIVDFYKYCNKCDHKNKSESEDPCWECLNNPSNTDTRRPVNYSGPSLKDS